jgi:hypothetical protein
VTEPAEWQNLQTTVQRVLREGRLGQPAFARVFLQAPGGPQAVTAVLEELTRLAGAWFGEGATRVHTVGAEGGGHLVALLRWPAGQSAILSVGPARAESARLDLTLLGSRGALYYRTPEGVGGVPA